MEDDNPLFGIDLSSSEDEFTNPEMTKPSKPPRDFQSEEDFQCTMQSYKPKVENGEIHTTLHSSLPTSQTPSKQLSQTIMHAIEELYFHGRYSDALRVSEDTLGGDLDVDFRKTVDGYRGRCLAKLEGEVVGLTSR